MELNFDGLRADIVQMLGGGRVRINTRSFRNDMRNFSVKDDVLTLLIHLGYLAYDEVTGQARIPNEEIRQEFARVVRDVRRDDTIRRIRESDQLLYNTVG